MKKLLLSLIVLTSFAFLKAQNVQTLSGARTITIAQDNTLTLANSEINFTYYLLNAADNSVVGTPQAGTGSILSFQTGSISETTSYKVFAAKPSYALAFNGIDGRVTIHDVTDLGLTTGFTIDCWINPTDISTNRFNEIFRKDNNGVGRILLGFQEYGTILSFGIDTAVDGYQELDIAIDPSNYTNQWVHILAYYDDATNTAKIYRDGVEIGSASRDGTLTPAVTPSSSYIGGTEFFYGKFASFRIWDKALTTFEERTIAKSNFLTNNEPNLVAYYPFSENIGTSLNDVTTNSNNGILSITYNWTTGITGGVGVPSNIQTITFSIAPEDSQDGGYLRKAKINELPIIPNSSDMVNSAVAADFDNDGDMDMAYTAGGAGDLSWYENDGNQNYTQNNILIGDTQWVTQITANDLDLDGDMDIILGGNFSASTQLRWLTNDGTGNFTLNIISNIMGDSHWEVVDIDIDGDMDIVSIQRSDGKIVWYENDGNQNFTENVISTLLTDPAMLKVVDMDDDNDMDFVVVSNAENKVVWFENDGNQNFVANTITTTDSSVNSVAVSDFEGDGDIDIFTASNNKVTWYKNDGNQNFSVVVIANDSDLGNIRLEDLDNDGDLDVLTSFSGIKWFENGNNKNFTKRVLLCCTTGIILPMNTIAIADSDNDGDLDVLTAAYLYNGILFRGLIWVEIDSMISSTSPSANQQNISVNSDITLNFNEVIDGATVNTNNIVVYGDQSGKINGVFSGGGTSTITFNPTFNFFDGEVIHVNITSQVKTVDGYNLLGQHAFDFRVAAIPYGFIPNVYTKNIISSSASLNRTNFPVDMDNDHDMDVLSYSGTELLWFKNDGSQNFTENSISVSADDSYLVYAIDLDLDGDMDAISISRNTDTTRWFENDGNQNFTEHLLPDLPIPGDTLGSMQPADFDGDGDIDIFINFVLTNEAILYENDGNENFTIIIGDDLVGGHAGRAVDMDLDGDMDILSAINGGNLVWYENDSKLSGSMHTIGSISENISTVYPIDMDLDGDIDIVAGTPTALIWYENDGSQNFTQSVIKAGNYRFGSIDAMDMDADGDIDIVVASGISGNTLYWYTNDGNQNFTENFIDTLDGNTSVFAVDMDNDGDMDVLSNARDSNEVSWYEFTGSTLSIQDVAVNAVSIYPNPTHNTLNIVSPQATIISIDIYDLQGREINKIQTNSQSNYQIDMSRFASSIYFIKINTNTGSITKKVIKK